MRSTTILVCALMTLVTFGSAFGQSELGTGAINGKVRARMASVPRNNHSGAANYTLEMRLSREFHIKEKYVLELLGEGFNLFNHPNFNQYNSTKVNVGPTIATNDVAVPVTMTNVATFATPFGDGGPPDGTNARRFQISARFRF